MRNLLPTVLAFYWATAFALLAAICVVQGDAGPAQALRMLGVTIVEADHAAAAPLALGPVLSIVFAISAVIFLWALLASLVGQAAGDTSEVFAFAFAAAAVALAAAVLVGATHEAPGLFAVAAAHLAALLGSYLVIHVEQRRAVDQPQADEEEDIRAAIRLMAAEAAQSAILSRLTGRGDPSVDEAR